MERTPEAVRRGQRRFSRLAAALLCSTTAGAHISAPLPTEIPINSKISDHELTVNLSLGSVVHMTFQAGKVDTVQIRIDGREYLASLKNCKLERPIHVDGFELQRDDLRRDGGRQDALSLLFDVGSESERQFGKLPRVQMSWREGRLVAALVTREVAQNSGFSSPLCDPDAS